jgi:hypothetical protein
MDSAGFPKRLLSLDIPLAVATKNGSRTRRETEARRTKPVEPREKPDASAALEERPTTGQAAQGPDQPIRGESERTPDEEHQLAERMYAESDRRWEAQQRFNALVETGYLN